MATIYPYSSGRHPIPSWSWASLWWTSCHCLRYSNGMTWTSGAGSMATDIHSTWWVIDHRFGSSFIRWSPRSFQNTFRVNMITGRKLLLLDASALCAMNIKNFDHIRHISYGIRMLFHFELTKFSSSISLPDEKPNELYLLFHTQTGVNYDEVRRSDLYRRMQILRERARNLDHWDLLYLWLRHEQERKYKELIGMVPRITMYKCEEAAKPPEEPEDMEPEELMCMTCIPPCDCDWTARDLRLPWRLECLPPMLETTMSKWNALQAQCSTCIPPCECRWPPRFYLTGTVIRCLQQRFPEKFCPIFDERYRASPRPSLVERWTRFSIWWGTFTTHLFHRYGILYLSYVKITVYITNTSSECENLWNFIIFADWSALGILASRPNKLLIKKKKKKICQNKKPLMFQNCLVNWALGTVSLFRQQFFVPNRVLISTFGYAWQMGINYPLRFDAIPAGNGSGQIHGVTIFRWLALEYRSDHLQESCVLWVGFIQSALHSILHHRNKLLSSESKRSSANRVRLLFEFNSISN